MSAPDQDFNTLAIAMQDFFNAVDWRTDVTVQRAADETEALFGAEAPLEAMIKACDHMRENEHDECTFWMNVCRALMAPELVAGGYVTLH